eukprot:gnl/TRDRNA2_/TRDRNA2_32601_c0_seq1.p1 gnl/TRDRNA2_/TRDRNA2_32601_c0~~gnl/TRDRNA2_/TRDRNA2_32601_c0_seq1.p1  ORF type:complete len:135 (+),score=21.33 gnl/TRDRNA2_/TRDRNA2_32601_c0_seq1:59-406(+)
MACPHVGALLDTCKVLAQSITFTVASASEQDSAEIKLLVWLLAEGGVSSWSLTADGAGTKQQLLVELTEREVAKWRCWNGPYPEVEPHLPELLLPNLGGDSLHLKRCTKAYHHGA